MWRLLNFGCFVLAFAGFCTATLAQRAAAQAKSSTEASAAQSISASDTLPWWLEKLNLSTEQRSQLQAVARDYDAQLEGAWRQCSDSYKATIQTEALLLAAIEDNFTDTQRKQAREHRHNLTPPVAAAVAKKAPAEPATAKPTAATAEEAAALGVVLTAEQIAAAGKLQEKYQDRLQTQGQEIRTLHNRLIALEMDRLEALEKVLTEPQRKLLREMRQSPPLPAREIKP